MAKGPSQLNDLNPSEWTRLSKSVWPAKEVSSPRERHHLEHGATFSVALAERAVKLYSKPGDLVFDPFLGVGTTLLAARNLHRRGIGIELYRKFCEVAEKVVNEPSQVEEPSEEVVNADCRELLGWVRPESVQLTFTSPPYANFISKSLADRQRTHKSSALVIDNNSSVKRYGDDPRDFGNLGYDSFLSDVRELMAKICRVTKPGGYNVWVVKDCRDTSRGMPLIDLHTDTARAGVQAGFKYHDLIVWDQNDQRRLVLQGYPSVFYVNINHTFLVVLRKPYRSAGTLR
jgi:DNA modification methylase